MLEVPSTACFISNYGKITIMHCLSCPFDFFKAGYGSVGCVFVLSGVSLCHRRAERCVWCCDQGVALRYTHSLSASLSLTGASRSACWSRWTRHMGRHSLQRPREGRVWVRLYLAQDTLCHPVCDR